VVKNEALVSDQLWVRGGFPDIFLASSEAAALNVYPGRGGIGSIRVLRPFPSRTWRGRISAGSARQPAALSNRYGQYKSAKQR
jgi:hypothetical protein